MTGFHLDIVDAVVGASSRVPFWDHTATFNQERYRFKGHTGGLRLAYANTLG